MASSLVLNRSPKVPAQETAAFGAIAERFRRAGALDKAVSLCQEGLKRFPDHVSARATLGWSLLDLGKYEEARLELEQVLRRAPDNLAAIRGLAELHDRFEHTLNLPMDGPGQWPPSAADVEELADASAVAVAVPECHTAPADSVAAASVADDGPAVMVPADMGMPIWSPVAVAPAAAPTAQASAAAHAESVTMPAAPALSRASGQSSVREIDFPASAAPEASVEASAPAEATVDLAALIAEAESLEAAAEAAALTPTTAGETPLDQAPTVDLLADLDLSAPQDLAAQLQMADDLAAATDSGAEFDLPLTIELAASDDASELDALAVVTAPETLDSAVTEPSEPEVVLEVSALEEPEALEAVFEATAAATAEPEPEVASVAMQEAPVEPEAGVEATAQVEPEVVLEAVALAEPEVVFQEPAQILAEEEVEHLAAVAAQEAVDVLEFTNVLAFAPVADAAVSSGPRTRQAHSALPALERMLRQVQARRQQLMAESVA